MLTGTCTFLGNMHPGQRFWRRNMRRNFGKRASKHRTKRRKAWEYPHFFLACGGLHSPTSLSLTNSEGRRYNTILWLCEWYGHRVLIVIGCVFTIRRGSVSVPLIYDVYALSRCSRSTPSYLLYLLRFRDDEIFFANFLMILKDFPTSFGLEATTKMLISSRSIIFILTKRKKTLRK